MKKIKIASLVGARPQFIKCGVIERGLRKTNHSLKHFIIHTGQHYDSNMSEVFFKQLKLTKPKYNLGIGGKSNILNISNMMISVEKVLVKEKIKALIVYGDTDTTLAGALVANKLNIKLFHIEAGLRSFNNKMHEESNRIITDHISDLLFIPNKISRLNLIREGIDKNKIIFSGDVMLDSILYFKSKIKKNKNFEKYFLLTIHRNINLNNVKFLKDLFSNLSKCKKKVIFPCHPNTLNILNEYKIEVQENIQLVKAVDYFEIINLIYNSYLVLTDSGGLQKETYFLDKPCLVLRKETEWNEIIDNKNYFLLGNKINKLNHFLNNFEKSKYLKKNLFGNGKSGEKIVLKIDKYLKSF